MRISAWRTVPCPEAPQDMNLSQTTMFSVRAWLCLVPWLTSVASGASFTNLDFESSTVPPLPQNTAERVATTAAFPGWTAWLGGAPQATVWHNGLSLGSPQINIVGPNQTFGILEGQFTVLLQTDPARGATLSQTGLIPNWAESLRCVIMIGASSETHPLPLVSVGGSVLGVVPLSANEFSIWTPILVGVDVAAWRGQVKELTIGLDVVPNTSRDLWLDSISFSPEPIPEPGVVALLLCGGLLTALTGWGRRSRGKP
jgi:hypothetical protein